MLPSEYVGRNGGGVIIRTIVHTEEVCALTLDAQFRYWGSRNSLPIE